MRLTVRGKRLIYSGGPSAPAASLMDSKIIFNGTISTPGAQFFCEDIKDYFLNIPMARYEYMNIPPCWFPQDIIDRCKIMNLVEKYGFFYVEICKGVHVLKQAARIGFDRLVKLLKHHGYYPLRSNPGIWCHETLPTKSAFCVEIFGINYTNPAHAHHLVDTLKKILHNIH